jgi:hypothetical protein
LPKLDCKAPIIQQKRVLPLTSKNMETKKFEFLGVEGSMMDIKSKDERSRSNNRKKISPPKKDDIN